MDKKDPIIDIVKGIAIILVVCGHVIQRSMFTWNQDYFLNPAFRVIYAFHMPLFVFVSGYLIAFSLNKRSPLEVFKTRCKSLLVPLVAWGILGLITNYCLKIPLNSSIWFVWFLFTLFMSSFLLLCSVELEKRLGLVAFGLVYVCLLIIPYNDFCFLYYIKWFYLFYIAGYFVNRWKLAISSKISRGVVFIISLAAFVGLVGYWTTSDYIYINQMNFLSNHYLDEVLRIAYRYVLGFLGIILVFFVGKSFLNTKVSSWLGVVGFYSLDIYLIQRYIVEGIYPIFLSKTHVKFDSNSPVFIYVFVPLMAMFFIGLCVIISKLFIRKSSVLTKLLLGGRGSRC